MNVQQRLSLEPLGPVIGAIIRGVDLSSPLPDSVIAGLRDALLRHQVLFFEDQDIGPGELRDFAARFGALHVHPIYPHVDGVPEIMELDNHAGNPTDNDAWHTDVTFIETPPMGSILSARQLPPSGGDTMWSSMTAAHDALSPAFRAFLAERTAVHDFRRAFPPDRRPSQSAGDAQYQAAREEHPPVTHPVVRTHPETGKQGLFVNYGFTARINDLAPRESRAILGFLHEHIQRPEFVVRWRWKPGSVAFWDNRCTQHFAVNDYLPHRRVMHRATILGDKPYYRA
ncbi:MAG TPA: taurine dioxygenase [Rhizomicrobium sp.]|jgi:taurine dioxygenase